MVAFFPKLELVAGELAFVWSKNRDKNSDRLVDGHPHVKTEGGQLTFWYALEHLGGDPAHTDDPRSLAKPEMVVQATTIVTASTLKGVMYPNPFARLDTSRPLNSVWLNRVKVL